MNVQLAIIQAAIQNMLRNFYDSLRSPPNFQVAVNHSKAQVIHKQIIAGSETCPCCNLPIQTIKYPILTDINVLSEHGTSYKYFKLIKIIFILLSINFVIAGIYNLYQNYKGDQCIKNKTCKKSLNNYLSILNRMQTASYVDETLDILYFIAILLQLALVRYISYNQNDYYNVDHDYDDEKTIKQCSVKIENIPQECRKSDILNYFQNGVLKGNPIQFDIIDCCLIYDETYLITKLKQTIKRRIEQENNISLKKIISDTVKQEFIVTNREQYLKFTGKVFITLSFEQEAKNFRKTFDYQYSASLCQRPSDVIWKNNKDQNIKVIYLKGFFLLFSWIPIIGIQVAKNDYILAHSETDEDQLYFNTFLSIVVAVILFTATKLSEKIIKELAIYHSNTKHRQKWKMYLQMSEGFLIIYFYLFPPIFTAVYSGEGTRQEKLWRSGGLSEDIIMIVLSNSILPILFTFIDFQYAIKLIRIIYYKYINRQSNLTQFEANQLYLRKINYNKKRIELTLLVSLCCYYGYIYPICYPITLLTLFCTYWLNKYYFLNQGISDNIKFKYRLPILLIFMLIGSQLGSSQIIHITYLGYNPEKTTNYIYYLKAFFLFYIFYYKKHWLFKKRVEYLRSNNDLMQCLQNNDLYTKYNPIIDEDANLSRFSRQAKFYSALQVKLLREIEKEIQNPIPNAQIQPI
ncbi:unnamed protein product [Paramecium sonneborni]|uniref:CSC1/OSCA1-like cytosolic domain-containing protein n=1 Tax=Paramecium sonneborni TaxID=65129 RepID=A0A8S1LIP9_9CILI|nr:unnamed protein product [Paramecium sonneborni]